MMKIFTDADADLSVLKGRKIAVIGYGSQGCAQALMLKDSGVDVVVGVRENGKSWKNAEADKQKVMTITEAARKADIVHLLLPDEVQQAVYENEIMEHMHSGKTLSFSAGVNIVFGLIKPPRGVDVIEVAPIAPGSEARKLYLENVGVPAVIAVYKNETGGARETALAMAKAMKFTKVGVMEGTFAEETHTDLFGEQVVLCGGLTELVKHGFDTLVEGGYPEEMAYFEVLHQLEVVSSLLKKGGISGMWNEVSNTAEYGGRTVGPKIIGPEVKEKMKEVLNRIESGSFIKEFMKEYRAGMPNLEKWRQEDKNLAIEKTGQKIRGLFKKPL